MWIDLRASGGGALVPDPAMFLTKIRVPMLAAGALALGVACSGSSAQLEPQPLETPRLEAPPAPASIDAAPNAGVAETLAPAPASEPGVRKSPMQALNQMVTAQALLVSLLLAPLSKGAAEQPLAKVDAPRASAPAPERVH